MILHPGILALLVGSSIVFVLTLYAALLGLRVLAAWDFDSHSQKQLDLERRTYLVSTILNYALGFQILSSLLFIYTLDDIHRLFLGAMCATGALNANPIGWWALAANLVALFAAAFWIALNQLDQRAEDYPVTRLKFALLVFVVPLVGIALGLQVAYFLGLRPEIITSCCGSLFTAGGTGLASSLAALPIRPMMWLFYGHAALFLALAVRARRRRRAQWSRVALSVVSAGFLIVSLAAIVSFLSLYIYRLPTHRCPFDVFQPEYGFVGYPIYGSLLLGVFFGALPGAFEPLRRHPSLASEVGRLERRWIGWSVGGVVTFLLLTAWPLLVGEFSLRGYF